MNRRESLKAISISSITAGLLLDACKPGTSDKPAAPAKAADNERLPIETARDKELNDRKFFTDHEMATITVLGDIIIPKDERSGSASDAGVPAFIEFIVKDKPEHQTPLRGGLRWLDVQSSKQFNALFKDATAAQQLELVTAIAYPAKAQPTMKQGVAFFDRMRGLVATGFFTSKMGIEDLGYLGNRPNKWEGVPDDIIKQYGLEDVKLGKTPG